MYFAVILMESKKLLVIPASYVLKLDVVGKINSGLKSYKRQVVFFSPENHYPNFKLPIREDFDESTDGIYMANILKAFDTKEEAESYADLRRNALPVNYYKHRVDHDDLDEATGNESDTDLVVVKREPIRCDSITDTVSPSEHSVFLLLLLVCSLLSGYKIFILILSNWSSHLGCRTIRKHQ